MKKNDKKIVKIINIIAFILIFGVPFLAIILWNILKSAQPFILATVPFTTLLGIVLFVWVRINKPSDNFSKSVSVISKSTILIVSIIIGAIIISILLFSKICVEPAADWAHEHEQGCR